MTLVAAFAGAAFLAAFVGAALAASALPIQAQPANSVASAPAGSSEAVGRMQADVTALTKFASRVPGTPGNKQAAAYVKGRFAQIFGGLVAYGIAEGIKYHGSQLAGWKIIFLVTGLLTVAIGVVFLFVMPDNQLNARWLSQEDRILAIERIRINQQGVGNRHFKLYQFWETLRDPLTWAFCMYALIADIPNGKYTSLANW